MSRLFSKKQRRILYAISGGKCSNCGAKLNGIFHADHKIPYSKSGATNTANGQALCVACNLRKGARIEH
jgi:5-methylcytosine-specific restriction endonuclease McrA